MAKQIDMSAKAAKDALGVLKTAGLIERVDLNKGET